MRGKTPQQRVAAPVKAKNDLPASYRGDRLFRGDIDWRYNVVIDDWNLEWDSYPQGFKRAGDLLVDRIKQDPKERVHLVFPIIFLYRHYLELRLKEIIRNGSGAAYATHHRLNDLWPQSQKYVKPFVSVTNLKRLDKYIMEFSKKDPQGMIFRYPFDKWGNLTLPGGIINLRHFRERMEEISQHLDRADKGVLAVSRRRRAVGKEGHHERPCT